jgi:CspA family cold shock protein
MNKGVVKFFNDDKGFGFIREEETEKEHFVHISGLIDEIREGDQVEFELESGKKGLNAVRVKVL